MTFLSAAEVHTGIGGILAQGSGQAQFSSVSIDTRTLKEGDLFFAIRGPNQDGHRFIQSAFSKGALGAVAEEGYEFPGEFPEGRVLYKVRDTHEALKSLAIWTRRRWPGTLVAITGSMGKTTTRQFAAHLLGTAHRVYQTPGNYNNLFGLPLALFGLAADHEFGIFEMGMSAPGEIAEMCRIAAPVAGVITNVAPVHLEFFPSIEDIARAKGELADALPDDGVLVYNADDPLVQRIAEDFRGNRVSFGTAANADVRADRIAIAGLEETRFRLSCAGRTVEAAIPLAGAHYVINLLPGIAIGARFGVPLERMIEGFATLTQAAMRGQLLRLGRGIAVIDDSYNSNPRALNQMIRMLSELPGFTRRILVAGEMLELGPTSDELHFECGRFAAGLGVDVLAGVRGAAGEMVRGFRQSCKPEARGEFFSAPEEASEFIKGEVRSGDLVLVKGSRGVHTEKVVQGLRAHFGTAKDSGTSTGPKDRSK